MELDVIYFCWIFLERMGQIYVCRNVVLPPLHIFFSLAKYRENI